ncbi:hypothetical protein [Pedobacter cryoconitis]|uniref:Uncharacterized protein n=1 Tax=Pedobacter cryoconitis TaxID=188932 RepID=A0A7X0MI89_9SPHI|nr:hypothetical protein [Pedobacter cryoconitis]MBB6499681.1 hypothetical protein [Pedobacter cryoconitis]
MLRTLSYLNLVFAVVYFLAYLQDGNRIVVFGLLVVVVFNWMALLNLENEKRDWSLWQWLCAGITLLYALYMGYGAVSLFIDAIGHHYYPGVTIRLIISGLLFDFTIFLQLLKSWYEKIDKKR